MKTKKNLTRLTSLILSLVLTLSAVPAHASGGYADLEDGSYVISSKADERFVLDVYGDVTKNKANVQVYQNVGNKTQTFDITETSGGWYSLTPLSNSSVAVNPFSDSPRHKTNVNVYKVDQKDCTQGFYFEETGGYYAIRSAYDDDLALTVEGSSLKNFANVRLETYDGRDTQLWKLTSLSDDDSIHTAGYTDDDVKAAVKAVGVQTDNDAWSMMCASICVSYARYLQTNVAYTPEQSSSRNGLAIFSLCGGQNYTAKNKSSLLSKVKAQLDAGGLAIIHVYSKYGQHWVLCYDYSGDGTSTSDFSVVDPWQGNLRSLAKCGYSLNSSGRVILC